MTAAVGEQTSLSWRKRRAGQRLIVGFEGTVPTAELKVFVREAVPAGFLVYGRNVEEPAQVRELNRELASLVPASVPAWRTVDQEGGRVLRVRSTPWPPARALGNRDDPRVTREIAAAIGAELRAMDFDLDWAPVADVDDDPANPAIGDRSFGGAPDVCARHVAAFVAGLHESGVAACAKHFPGQGDARADSHVELPMVECDPDEIRHRCLPPFRAAVAAGARFVLAGHVCFPAVDEDVPASLSRAFLTTWLREELAFDGVVCADDLSMGALAGFTPVEAALDRACRAGVDLFLVSRPLELAIAAWEALVRLQEGDPAHDRIALDAEKRVMAERRRFMRGREPAPDLGVVGSLSHRVLAAGVEASGLV